MTLFAPSIETAEERRRRGRDEELALLLLLLGGERASLFTYDPQRLRFTTPQGTLPMRQVRKAVRAVIEGVKGELHTLNERLSAGEITVHQWQADAAGLIKDLHVAVQMVSAGGAFHTTTADVAGVEGAVYFQLDHLLDFAVDIERGYTLVEVKALDGTGSAVSRYARRMMTGKLIEMRLDMYADASGNSFDNNRREKAKDAGMLYERNILGRGEHCEKCIEQTALKWVPIGTLLPIGARSCLTNCLCSLTFSREKPDA